jgi:hypothetical protein
MAQVGSNSPVGHYSGSIVETPWTEENVVAVLREMKEFLDGHKTPIANKLYDKVVPLLEWGEAHLREMEEWRKRRADGANEALIERYDAMIKDMLDRQQKQLTKP